MGGENDGKHRQKGTESWMIPVLDVLNLLVTIISATVILYSLTI